MPVLWHIEITTQANSYSYIDIHTINKKQLLVTFKSQNTCLSINSDQYNDYF